MPTQTETRVQGAVWSTKSVDALPNSSFAFVSGDVRKLPYKDADGKVDLPHVRNALAMLSRTQGIPDDEKAKIKTKLQNALKNTQAANDTVMSFFSPIQASTSDSGQQELPQRVMLLREGTFTPEKYDYLDPIPVTADDLREYKDNFDKGVGMADQGQTGIPVDYGHKSGENAAAWIKAMDVEVNAEGQHVLWATQMEYSGSGRKALLDKEYKLISADFYPKTLGSWVDPESGIVAQNVIVGAGLTNRPMFTGNKPVMASSEHEGTETGTLTVININASENKEQHMPELNLEKVRIKAADEVSGAEQRFLQAHAEELSGDEQKKFEIVAPVQATEEGKPKVIKASEVTGTEGTVSVQASELKAVNDQVKELKTTNEQIKASIEPLQAAVEASKKKEAEAFVDELIGQGKIVASEKDKLVGRVLADDSMKEILEALPSNKLLGTKQGSSAQASDMTAKEQLMKKAKELMAEAPADKPLGIQAAMIKAAEVDEELAKRVGDENRALAGVTAAMA